MSSPLPLAMNFQAAVDFIRASRQPTSNETKLRFYSLYKIATVGPFPSDPRPSLFDFQGRAKHDAWTSLSNNEPLSAEDAKLAYCTLARKNGWSDDQPVGQINCNEIDYTTLDDTDEENFEGNGMVSVSTPQVEQPLDNPDKTSLLHDYSLQGQETHLRNLLAAQTIKIDEKDGYGFTALHLAADRGHMEIVRLLLQSGADPLIKDDDGMTVLDICNECGHPEIAFLINQSVQSSA